MKRQLNTIKKFFDAGATALSEVLVPSGKGQVVVLRAKSTTDVAEGDDENQDSTEISNSIQLPPKQLSKSVDNVVAAEFDIKGASETSTAKDVLQTAMSGLSKSTEALSYSTAVEPLRVPNSLPTRVAGSPQQMLSPSLNSEDFFSDCWSAPTTTTPTSSGNAELNSQDSLPPGDVTELDLGFVCISSTARLDNKAALHRRAVRPTGRRVQSQFLPRINCGVASQVFESSSLSPPQLEVLSSSSRTSPEGNGANELLTRRLPAKSNSPPLMVQRQIDSERVDIGRNQSAAETTRAAKDNVPTVLGSSGSSHENTEKLSGAISKVAEDSTSNSKEIRELTHRPALAGIVPRPPPVAAKPQQTKADGPVPHKAKPLRRLSDDLEEQQVVKENKTSTKKISAPEMMTRTTELSVATDNKVEEGSNKVQASKIVANPKIAAGQEMLLPSDIGSKRAAAQNVEKNDSIRSVGKTDAASEVKASSTGNCGGVSPPLASFKVKQNATSDKTEVLNNSKTEVTKETPIPMSDQTEATAASVKIGKPNEDFKKKLSADTVVSRNVQQISADKARKLSDPLLKSMPKDKLFASPAKESPKPEIPSAGSVGVSQQIDRSTSLKEETFASSKSASDAADNNQIKPSVKNGSDSVVAGSDGNYVSSNQDKYAVSGIKSDRSTLNDSVQSNKQQVGKVQTIFLKGSDVKETETRCKPVGRLPVEKSEEKMASLAENTAASVADSSDAAKATSVVSTENKNKQIDSRDNPAKSIITSTGKALQLKAPLSAEKTTEQSVTSQTMKHSGGKASAGESSSVIKEEPRKTSDGKVPVLAPVPRSLPSVDVKKDTNASDSAKSVTTVSTSKQQKAEETTSEVVPSNAKVPVGHGNKTDLKSTGQLQSSSSELPLQGTSKNVSSHLAGDSNDKAITMTTSARPRGGQNGKGIVVKESESLRSAEVQKKITEAVVPNKNDGESSATLEVSTQKVEAAKVPGEKLPDENSARSFVTTAHGVKLRPTAANTKFAHQSMILPSAQNMETGAQITALSTNTGKSARLIALRTGNPGSSSRPASVIEISNLSRKNAATSAAASNPESSSDTLPSGSSSAVAVDVSSKSSSDKLNASTVNLTGGESKLSSDLGRVGAQSAGLKLDSAPGSLANVKSVGLANVSEGVINPASRSVKPSVVNGNNGESNSSSSGSQLRSVNTVAVQPQTSVLLKTQKAATAEKAEPSTENTAKSSEKVSEKVAPLKSAGTAGRIPAVGTTANSQTHKSTSSKVLVGQSSTSILPARLPEDQDGSSQNKLSTATVEPPNPASVRPDSSQNVKKLTSSSDQVNQPSWIELAKQKNLVWMEGKS